MRLLLSISGDFVYAHSANLLIGLRNSTLAKCRQAVIGCVFEALIVIGCVLETLRD